MVSSKAGCLFLLVPTSTDVCLESEGVHCSKTTQNNANNETRCVLKLRDRFMIHSTTRARVVHDAQGYLTQLACRHGSDVVAGDPVVLAPRRLCTCV